MLWKIQDEKKYLITLSDWFVGCDGMRYQSIWGKFVIDYDNPENIRIGESSHNIIFRELSIIAVIECADKPVVDYDQLFDANGNRMPTKIYIIED